MQAVIGTTSGDTHQFELDGNQAAAMTGRQIGDEVDGATIGISGYTLEITGGSDSEGFPMRESVEGTGRKRLLAGEGVGSRNLESGERKRTSVRGNTVSRDIAQLNLRVVEEGDESVADLLADGDDAEEE